MSTGPIENWSVNPLDVGPMYPFAGYEFPMFLICFLVWIIYTVWQLKFEKSQYQKEEKLLKEGNNLIKVIKNQ